MQFNAVSFHPDLTDRMRNGAAFADRMNALLRDAGTDTPAAATLAFREIGTVLRLHGYESYWNRARPLLWAALHYQAEQYEIGLNDALERIGCLLEANGYKDGWMIFDLEIRPRLCWPDSF